MSGEDIRDLTNEAAEALLKAIKKDVEGYGPAQLEQLASASASVNRLTVDDHDFLVHVDVLVIDVDVGLLPRHFVNSFGSIVSEQVRWATSDRLAAAAAVHGLQQYPFCWVMELPGPAPGSSTDATFSAVDITGPAPLVSTKG